MFYEVIPTEVYRAGGGALTYSSDHPLKPGHIVLIPLGKRVITGIVSKKVPKVDFPTKPIVKLLHPYPIPSHLLKSISWLSKYYLSPLPACANLMILAGLAAKTVQNNPLNTPKKPSPKSARSPLTAVNPGISATAPEPSSHPTPQKSAQNPEIPPIPLNKAQQNALQSLQEAPGATRLLRGVTGSGKTNIYLKMAENALKAQKSTILLVPEIALTSQLVKIFEQTFKGHVVLIHSNQTLVERRQTWLDILRTTFDAKEPLIIIGPRSALLTPVHNLGLIIIDEAHESAYYQENTPRYSALRLASFIASQLQAQASSTAQKSTQNPIILQPACILGSATPNLVDYHLATIHNSLTELSEKAKSTAIDPEISLVDLKDRANFTKNRYFSDLLLTKIQNNIQDEHQTLIFHNRRGSAPMTICEDCGWQALCPNCYLPLTLHADDYTLSCHLCGHSEKIPTSCPECHHAGVIHKGFGTKLLESELSRLFPEAKIARFDGDNKKSEDLAALYDDVKTGNIDVLIGTQTLARGLDLPHLATVGIVQADAGLALPDFSAEERTFELLTQVIGRVGRGHLDTASVIVQTYQPNHPVLQTALRADFPKFAEYLTKNRQKSHLPPFAHLARLSVTYKTEKTTLAKIQTAYTHLQSLKNLEVSPPAPAFHERGARGFTWQLILKSPSRKSLVDALLPFTEQSQFSIVLDPPSLL
jgi:primosomal protein N' (replication factor Y)